MGLYQRLGLKPSGAYHQYYLYPLGVYSVVSTFLNLDMGL